jgi:hypothetical protein
MKLSEDFAQKVVVFVATALVSSMLIAFNVILWMFVFNKFYK